MKTITSAEFRNAFADITETVEVRRYNQILGTWTPAGVDMEEPVKKAVEPEAVKSTSRGKLTKGLGDQPWESGPKQAPINDPHFGYSRPAPKPGKK